MRDVRAGGGMMTDRGVFLEHRAEYLFVYRRLQILNQHPEAHFREIRRLEKVQADIIRDTPNVTDGLRPDDFVPTRLEV
jgi:hypothetical protein